MKINKKLLPIKGHYFIFMAAMGPILPQLQVFGKEMGISSVVMGTVTGILPILCLIAKPTFGMIIDVYRDYRKTLFIMLIFIMGLSYSLLYVIPERTLATFQFEEDFCQRLETCNVTHYDTDTYCTNITKVSCLNANGDRMNLVVDTSETNSKVFQMFNTSNICESWQNYTCTESVEIDPKCMKSTWEFWVFIFLMCIGTVAFNVVNSVSDAICFDVIGEEFDYGHQRVWGTIGFGLTALISGLLVNLFSYESITYTPALIVMLVFTVFDIICCTKLKLPIIQGPDNIFKDLSTLLKNMHTKIFFCFAAFAGILDGFIVYYLFWYLEDLAVETNTQGLKLLEGLIVAAETLFGEVIFFSVSGKIIERFGHATCFSMCFLFYSLRLVFISIIPNPWWALLVEVFMQGPTYALTYTSIVAYANDIAPPGLSATMQGIAAGVDDGFGYAVGSFLGGIFYKYVGGGGTFQIFALFGLVCSISHIILHKTLLRKHEAPKTAKSAIEYKSPEEAMRTQYEEIESGI